MESAGPFTENVELGKKQFDNITPYTTSRVINNCCCNIAPNAR
jgi:hypothetical protein